MTRRLQNLRVKNFRQLKDLSIESLGDVNLIVGGNNSGKSTFLEAIRLLAGRGAPSLIEELLASHGEYQFGPSPSVDVDAPGGRALANLFSGRRFPFEDDEPISIGEMHGGLGLQLEHVALEEFFEERDVNGETLTTRRLRRVPKDSASSDSEFVEAFEIQSTDDTGLFPSAARSIAVPLTDFFSSRRALARARYEDAALPVPVSYVGSQAGGRDSLAELWDEVVLTEGERYALEALQLIEPKTSGLAFVLQAKLRWLKGVDRPHEDRVAVVKLLGVPSPIPLRAMGDGMTRVLHLVLSALRAKGGFLLVDEFENGLHYSIQQQIWEILFFLAKLNDVQIFATTHSSDCVRAFSKVAVGSEQLGQLIRFERDLDADETVTSIVEEHSLDDLLTSGIEVR